MATHLSKTGAVRTFLAVELPPGEKQKLGRLERLFAPVASSARWVAPDLLHITLRFLGSVPASRLGEVERAAERSASRLQQFSVPLADVGAFPNERSPRVIWVGLQEGRGLEALRDLHRAVEEELERVGFEPEERPFSPHITLARARDGLPALERRQLGDTLARAKAQYRPSGALQVKELTVMRSDLRPSGPVYTPMARFPLAGAGRSEG